MATRKTQPAATAYAPHTHVEGNTFMVHNNANEHTRAAVEAIAAAVKAQAEGNAAAVVALAAALQGKPLNIPAMLLIGGGDK